MVFVVLFPTGGRSLFRSEIPGIAREAVAETWRAVEIFLCAGLIYLVLSLIITRATSLVERALSPWQFGARQ